MFYHCVSNLYNPLGTAVGFWWTELTWTDVEGRKEGRKEGVRGLGERNLEGDWCDGKGRGGTEGA